MLAAPTESRALAIGLAMLALLALAAISYAPGLNGVFVFDSIERVIRNDALQITSLDAEQLLGAAYAGQADYPQRGLAYLSLALNYYFADQQFAPWVFKLTNLIIHLLNGLLVLVLAGLVLQRWRQVEQSDQGQRSATGGATPCPVALLAVLAMGLWLLHPMQLTSVLYVVQRMASLAGTWVLIGAIAFMLARARLEAGRRHALLLIYASVVLCTGLGFLCKQSALLLPAYVAVLEFFLFQRSQLPAAQKRGLLVFFAVTLVLPLAGVLLILLFSPEVILAGFEGRDFSMLQRLMTQARVLFFYLGLLMIPTAGRFGLYHDDFLVSAGPLEPLTTLLALLAWGLVLFLLVLGARRRAPWAFAAAWFLAGHAMESTILPLEQVHEHRNYAPAVGIWIAVAHYAGRVWDHAVRVRALLAAAACVLLLSLALITHGRAQAWSHPATLMASLAMNHPASYRSTMGYAFNSIPGDADLSLRFDAFKRAASLNDRAIVGLIEMMKLATALRRFIGSGESTRPLRGASGRAPPISELGLQADAAHNTRLLATLDEAINQRLSAGPVPTDSVVALIALVDCALNGNLECMALSENTRVWHESALSNTRLPEDFTAALQLSLAKIHASRGEADAAVGYARRAGASAPDNLAYRLQEATLYALLERWDDLGEVLDDVGSRFPLRSKSDATFRLLQARLAQAR